MLFNEKEINNNLKNKTNKIDKIIDILTTESNKKLKELNNNNNKNKQNVFQDTISNFNDIYNSRRRSILRKIPRNSLLERANSIIKSKDSYILKLNIFNFNLFCKKKKKDEIKLFKLGKESLKKLFRNK